MAMPGVEIDPERFDPLLWHVWRQDTLRIMSRRPNGEVVTDHQELLWRSKKLGLGGCPFWDAYRDLAQPVVTEAAREMLPGRSDEVALQALQRELLVQPLEVMATIRQLAQYSVLNQVVETEVWPWLESEWSSARDVPQVVGGGDPRQQIAPLAMLAYRLHELGTQIAYLAQSELHDTTDGQSALLDEGCIQALSSCAAVLMQHAVYSRTCAAQIRDNVMLTDELTVTPSPIGSGDGGSDYQWWTDLTTRPVTSNVRAAIAEASAAGALATLISDLAGESDSLTGELGDAFQRAGWNRGIAGGIAVVGPELRAVAGRLAARRRPGQ